MRDMDRAFVDNIAEAVVRLSEGRTIADDLLVCLPPMSDNEKISLLAAKLTQADDIEALLFNELDASHPALQGIDIGALGRIIKTERNTQLPFPFEISILENASFSIMSPLTGKQVLVTHSLLIEHERSREIAPVIYYFVHDEEPFVIQALALQGNFFGFYFFKRRLYLAKKTTWLLETINLLKAAMVVFADDTARYLSKREPFPVALVCGVVEHFGHAVLNEYDAFARCADDGKFENVAALIKGWVGLVDPGMLFPEIADRPVIEVSNLAEAYRACVAHSYMVVRPTCGLFSFSLGLQRRFQEMRRRYCQPPSVAEETLDLLQEADQISCLVWFEIRTNDRVWLGQVDGIRRITAALQERYRDVGVILAGWSIPSDCAPRPGDLEQIKKDWAVAEAMRDRIDPSVKVFNVVGTPFVEKVMWSFLPTAFVSVYSSGMIFPMMIGRVPGVIHGTDATRRNAPIIDSKLSFVEDCVSLGLVFNAPEDDPISKNHRAWTVANYNLDNDRVVAELLAIVDQTLPTLAAAEE